MKVSYTFGHKTFCATGTATEIKRKLRRFIAAELGLTITKMSPRVSVAGLARVINTYAPFWREPLPRSYYMDR